MICGDPDYRGREANFSHVVTAKVKNIFEKSLATRRRRWIRLSTGGCASPKAQISVGTGGFTRRVEDNALPPRTVRYGRGAGVGRGLPKGLGLAVGEGLGVDVGVALGDEVGVAVAVAVGVDVGVGVELAVGVGVGVPPAGPWIAAIMGEPVLKKPTVALELCGG